MHWISWYMKISGKPFTISMIFTISYNSRKHSKASLETAYELQESGRFLTTIQFHKTIQLLAKSRVLASSLPPEQLTETGQKLACPSGRRWGACAPADLSPS